MRGRTDPDSSAPDMRKVCALRENVVKEEPTKEWDRVQCKTTSRLFKGPVWLDEKNHQNHPFQRKLKDNKWSERDTQVKICRRHPWLCVHVKKAIKVASWEQKFANSHHKPAPRPRREINKT